MSEKNRFLLREIIQQEALAWAIEMVSPQEIDQINILNASFEAMNRAVAQLKITPQLLLIDGNRFRTQGNIPYQCVVKETESMPISPPLRSWLKPNATSI